MRAAGELLTIQDVRLKAPAPHSLHKKKLRLLNDPDHDLV